jgi:hypothetical protein
VGFLCQLVVASGSELSIGGWSKARWTSQFVILILIVSVSSGRRTGNLIFFIRMLGNFARSLWDLFLGHFNIWKNFWMRVLPEIIAVIDVFGFFLVQDARNHIQLAHFFVYEVF